MNLKIENPWIVVLLLVLAILSGWQLYQLSMNGLSARQRAKHFPDSIGYKLVLKRYDKTGFLESISSADQATHFPDTRTTYFEKVNMQMFSRRPGVSPWLITAPAGQAVNRGEKFVLNGQVLMQQAAYADHAATQIKTSEVTIVPNNKLITSAEPVVMIQPGLNVNAVGFQYNYDTQILNLLSQVQIHYVPSQMQKQKAKK